MDGTRKRWAGLVKRWRRSGQTARGFAAGVGINPGTLMYWASRLKREGRVVEPRGAERRDSKAEVERGGFVELISGPIEERRFEIELADGRQVRVPPAFDAAALERLLGVLASTRR